MVSSSIPVFATATLARWHDIRQHALPRWIYRGQCDASRDLRTSLERCCDRNVVPAERRPLVEGELVREFKRAYHQYAANTPPTPGADLEWLSLMQHHGAPTRLLDFTYSIYVASYFAVESADGEAAVWAVNARWALDKASALMASAGKSAVSIKKLADRFWEGTEAEILPELFFSPSPVALAYPVNPFRLNARLRIQKGVFLVPGDVQQSFMANLRALPGHENAENVLRIVISKCMQPEAIRDLHQMNITRTTLFPGLDGYAQALGVYHPVFDPDGQLWKVLT